MKMIVEPTGGPGAAVTLQGLVDLRGRRLDIILIGSNVDMYALAGNLAG